MTASCGTWLVRLPVKEKIAVKFNVNNVFLLGDAAHIHSPAGAKGMNLCIEDSYIFSQLVNENREHEYDKLRRPKIKKAVGILGQLTDKLAGRNFIGNAARNNLGKLSVFFPLIMPQFRKFILGLN